MDERQTKVTTIYRAAMAIRESMQLIYNGTTPDHAKFGAFRSFAEKYNILANEAAPEITNVNLLSTFITENMKSASSTIWPFQKEIFDGVLANLTILISLLEQQVGAKESEIDNLRNFFQANLRKAIFSIPEAEKDVQNAVESLLIGHGLQKGIDYDRETGRVKISSKEVIPDFIFYKINLACEVKLIKDKTRIGSAIDEINADIKSYMAKYSGIIFIVYDMGFIRDENEFVSSFNKNEGIHCIVIKN